MKIVFAGTPHFAEAPFQRLISSGAEIAAVLTQPDRPQGRKGTLTPPPIKVLAESYGIPVFQPERLREDYAALRGIADLMVTCAYGQILTQEVLDLFPFGVWNIHASLLPAYRGAAPIARAIMDGCKETGISVMKTELGLDTGDVLLQRKVPIGETDTCGTLTEKLSFVGAELIVRAVDLIGSGKANPEKQGEGFVCKKVSRTQIDFSRSSKEVSALIRGLSPAPLAFGVVNGLTLNFFMAEAVPCTEEVPAGTVIGDNPKQGLLVRCGEGAVRISELQSAGGKKMSARDFLNGRKIQKGMRFDQPVL